MMSRKHYVEIVKILVDTKAYSNVELVKALVNFFESDNPEFSYVRFYLALQTKLLENT